MTHLLLIRHPQTDWNVEGRYQGQTDVELNAAGIAQAESLAVELEGCRLDAVYTSDLRRARFVAELLASTAEAPLVVDPRLREINQGEWEGLLGSEVKERWPEIIALRKTDPLAFSPPGGEPLIEVRARVMTVVDEIRAAHVGGAVAVVSHGLALAVVRVELRRLPMTEVWGMIPPNCEVIKVEA